jgi:hypothetical protein
MELYKLISARKNLKIKPNSPEQGSTRLGAEGKYVGSMDV